MSVIEYSDIRMSLDDEGYLEHLDDWNEKVSLALSERMYGRTQQKQKGGVLLNISS